MHHKGTQTLETTRLVLRRYTMTDAGDMFENWVTDPEVCRFWTWDPHKSIAETKAVLAKWIAAYDDNETYHWVIVHKEAGQAIGYIYLTDIDNQASSVSVHYLVSRAFWNRGFMTEACRAVAGFAFDVVGVQCIHTWHHVDNPASGTVMRKVGFRCVGTAYKQYPECERINGNYDLYEMTKSMWVSLLQIHTAQ